MNYNKADFIASYGISSQLPESDRPELSFSGRSNVGKSSVINRLLGTSLSRQEMVDILLPLGFRLEGDVVVCPTLRNDVKRDCDLAEEVARYVGYNKMPSTLMKGVAEARPTPRQSFDEKLTRTLAGYGLWECENFSFYSAKCFDAIHLPENDPLRNAVVISNPLGEDTSIMRTTALPSMLETLARNYSYRCSSRPPSTCPAPWPTKWRTTTSTTTPPCAGNWPPRARPPATCCPPRCRSSFWRPTAPSGTIWP